MEIVAGTIMIKNNKILMVKESKKECYGKWSFPAGHLENQENVFDTAKRETKEETGCTVNLKKVFPIIVHNSEKRQIIMIYFLADVIEESNEYNKDEIIETKWIEINQIKNMKKEELRCYNVTKNIIKFIENNRFYDLDVLINLEEL